MPHRDTALLPEINRIRNEKFRLLLYSLISDFFRSLPHRISEITQRGAFV
jgi:hypothetical protein